MRIPFICGLLLLGSQALGQGTVWFYTPSARTRIGSFDGPFAGPGIWGQLLVGPTTESLTPIGIPVEHNVAGFISAGFVSSANVPCNTIGYAQLIAWDGRLWGTDLGNVPFNQRGVTDVVPVGVRCESPFIAPLFNQAAVVPIPEPGVAALFAVGCGVAAIGLCRSLSHTSRKHEVRRRHQLSKKRDCSTFLP